MMISRRKYYFTYVIATIVIGVLIVIGALITNQKILHIDIVDYICKQTLLGIVALFLLFILLGILVNHGIYNWINKARIRKSLVDNLLTVGAYIKQDGLPYVILPKIKIAHDEIRIQLTDIRIRTILERYLNSFSTALPNRYNVEDFYISNDNSSIVIKYEDIKTLQKESYSLCDYIEMVKSLPLMTLYFDRKHALNLNTYPHFLITGSSGSGKTYLMQSLLTQAIVKGFDIVCLDIKRSYGLYSAYMAYHYEVEDIIDSLKQIESEMYQRMQDIEPLLNKNPQALAIDMGYKPKLIIIEEYIALQSAMDKKQKEEFERIVKSISVLARQANIHLVILSQSAGTENIQSSTRSNLNKIILGYAQSNILTATFGVGAQIPMKNAMIGRGEGLIQIDGKITTIRVPEVRDLEELKSIVGSAEGN